MISLTFEDTRVEVALDAEGGLEALAAEVQAKLGLHPDSFSIFDEFGKVEDSIALQRALDMAGDSSCELQVRESPQWKTIREMETKISMLVARCPVVDRVLMDIEERSAKRFEKLASAVQSVDVRATLRSNIAGTELRASLEELDNKVSKSIAPLLQSVALQEMDLKATLDSLAASLFAKEMDAKINSGIAPMLQSMALQQMDLKEKLDSLQESPSCRKCEGLVDSLRDTRKEVDEVTTDMGVFNGSLAEAHTQLKALQAEVNNLSEQPTAGGDMWGNILSAARQDTGKSPKQSKNNLCGAGYEEGYSQWIEGSAADLFSSPIAYSKKSYSNNMNNVGSAVPFARVIAPRQLDRMSGSRSLPQLPPVR